MLYDDDDPLRSKAHQEQVMRALADVGTHKGRLAARQTKKLPPNRRGRLSWELKDSEANPNDMIEVTIRLPKGLVISAGNKLQEYAYEGVRDRVSDWWGPRFVMVLRAKELRAAERYRERFTERFQL